MDDARGEISGEGQPPGLVRHNLRGDAALRQRGHGPHEVLAVADHPARAHEIVAGGRLHCGVTASLGLAVDAERAGRLILGMDAGSAVEGVLARDVHQRETVCGCRTGQVGRTGGVGPPGQAAPVRRLGAIDVGPGGGVDDDVVGRPVPGRHLRCVRDVHLGQIDAGNGVAGLRQLPHELAAELAASTGDQHTACALGLDRHWRHLRHARMRPVFIGQDGPLQRNGPRHRGGLVGEVEERVRRIGRPVIVDQIGVGGIRLQSLIGVPHAFGDEHGH